jgi:Fe/S biogenesis protein NfuA
VIDFVNVDGGGLRIENPNPVWVEPTARAVGELIEGRINPGILSHGGYVEMVDYREGVVYITMLGGCQGCAMSAMTLKMGIEQAIRQAVPEIREVVDMTNHTQGTNPFYR